MASPPARGPDRRRHGLRRGRLQRDHPQRHAAQRRCRGSDPTTTSRSGTNRSRASTDLAPLGHPRVLVHFSRTNRPDAERLAVDRIHATTGAEAYRYVQLYYLPVRDQIMGMRIARHPDWGFCQSGRTPSYDTSVKPADRWMFVDANNRSVVAAFQRVPAAREVLGMGRHLPRPGPPCAHPGLLGPDLDLRARPDRAGARERRCVRGPRAPRTVARAPGDGERGRAGQSDQPHASGPRRSRLPGRGLRPTAASCPTSRATRPGSCTRARPTPPTTPTGSPTRTRSRPMRPSPRRGRRRTGRGARRLPR